jgi:Ca-activated chloride channel family protein
VVVLVTDGSNNAGEIDPTTASDIAKALEVRVYTVLVGRGGQVPIPVQMRDPMTGEVRTVRTMADVQIDEKLLETIAARTGAEFFRATDPQSLRRIFERIDALEKTEIRQAMFRRYRDLFPPVLYLTALCLVMAGILWLGGLRVIPV